MERKELGNRIKFYREGRKMTKNALANKAGISPTYIYQLEEGLKSPTIEYLDYICQALGITLHNFFSFEDREDDLQKVLTKFDARQKKSLSEFLKTL